MKAALTAKREPSSASSRIASPALGAPSSTSETPGKKAPATESTTMEGVGSDVDVVNGETSRTPEVRVKVVEMMPAYLINAKSPWLPELVQYFEDLRKIAPGNAYDVVG